MEFNKIDENKSGFLEYDQLKSAIQKVKGDKVTTEEIYEIIMQLDYAKNNKINYSEFISATIDVSAFLTEQKLEAIFLSFDAHNTGKLTKEK